MAEKMFQYRRPLLRIGSITFLTGLAIFTISTAFHASREDPTNHLRVFAEYANSQFLNDGGNWERKATNIPSAFLFRLPASKGRPASLAIEINPIDTHGSITKKRGVVIRSSLELDEISRLLSHPKVSELSKKIDEVKPKRDSTTTEKGCRDIFEI
jgi:hypothetical protein